MNKIECYQRFTSEILSDLFLIKVVKKNCFPHSSFHQLKQKLVYRILKKTSIAQLLYASPQFNVANFL